MCKNKLTKHIPNMVPHKHKDGNKSTGEHLETNKGKLTWFEVCLSFEEPPGIKIHNSM